MTLRTADVGGDSVSGVHLDGLARNPRTELVAIRDRDGELLAALDLDWVHVRTPVQTHRAIAKTVVEAGIRDRMPVPLAASRWTMRLMEEVRDVAYRARERGGHSAEPAIGRGDQ